MKTFFTLLFLSAISIQTLQAQVAEKAEDISPLLIGETLPDAPLKSENGETANLYDAIKEKPTVVVFYRGGWCPFCNAHLAALAVAENEIIESGYQIIAITPDNYTNLKPTVTTDKINYKVFSDPEGKLIQQAGLAFKTPEPLKSYFEKNGKGKVSDVLPVPSVMVINPQAEILFEYINPNYKKRISPELLVAVLKNLDKAPTNKN